MLVDVGDGASVEVGLSGMVTDGMSNGRVDVGWRLGGEIPVVLSQQATSKGRISAEKALRDLSAMFLL